MLSRKYFILLGAAIAGVIAYLLWPKQHAHRVRNLTTKTHATWFINPFIGKDTGSIVFRIENDTIVKTATKIDVDNMDTTWSNKWVRDTTYFVPFRDSIRNSKGKAVYDSVKKQWRDTVIFRQYPNQYIIHDDDKHYN